MPVTNEGIVAFWLPVLSNLVKWADERPVPSPVPDVTQEVMDVIKTFPPALQLIVRWVPLALTNLPCLA